MMNVTTVSELNILSASLGVPFSASIELTTMCNFRCEHCYIPSHSQELSYSQVIRFLDELKEMGVFEITLTGGEVALHSEFMRIVRYIRKKGFRLVIYTNLSLLTRRMMKELSELHVKKISTTLFSLDDDINSSITKHNNSGHLIMNRIVMVKEYGIPLEIKVPLMKKNYSGYMEILEYGRRMGCEVRYGSCITKRTNGDEFPYTLALEQEELNLFVLKYDKEFKNNKHLKVHKDDDWLCDAVKTGLHIGVDGNVYPCISFPYSYGNAKFQKLSDIWYNSERRHKLLEIRYNALHECTSCEYIYFCNRCPGLAYSEQNTLTGCSKLNKMLAVAKAEVANMREEGM